MSSNYNLVKKFTEESKDMKCPTIPVKMDITEVKFLIKMVVSEMMELAQTVSDEPINLLKECLDTDLPKKKEL
jgi:hypothetical protein